MSGINVVLLIIEICFKAESGVLSTITMLNIWFASVSSNEKYQEEAYRLKVLNMRDIAVSLYDM